MNFGNHWEDKNCVDEDDTCISPQLKARIKRIMKIKATSEIQLKGKGKSRAKGLIRPL